MDEKKIIREKLFEVIEESKFNHIKCGEILVKISDLFIENNCNNIETTYILDVLGINCISQHVLRMLKLKEKL